VLYLAVAVTLSGLVPWQSVLDDAAPVVNALKKLSVFPGAHRLHWVRLAVLFGAMTGMISSLLVYQLGQARVWFAMSRDGLLPRAIRTGDSGVERCLLHPVDGRPAHSHVVAVLCLARYRAGDLFLLQPAPQRIRHPLKSSDHARMADFIQKLPKAELHLHLEG